MADKRFDFSVVETGSILLIAATGKKDLSPVEIGEALAERADGDLIERGKLLAMEMYQDDSFHVRFVMGDLTAREVEEWVAHVRWKLHIPGGKLLVTGTVDLDEDSIDIEPAVSGAECWNAGLVTVPAGDYQVDVYSYAPHDLTKAWGHIESPDLFGTHPDLEPEAPLAYFKRTRPNAKPPTWMRDNDDDKTYVNLLIHLSPLTQELELPPIEEGWMKWTFRKPALCPLGIWWGRGR